MLNVVAVIRYTHTRTHNACMPFRNEDIRLITAYGTQTTQWGVTVWVNS